MIIYWKRKNWKEQIMANQIEKKQYIPNLISLLFSISMFLLMMVPHSQYDLLNEMLTLSNKETINLCVILPSIATVFVIIAYCFAGMMSLLSLLTSYFYNYHFVSRGILIASWISVLLQSFYFFSGLGGVLDNGVRVIAAGNGVIYFLNLLFLGVYTYFYFRLIENPYQKIKREAAVHLNEKEEKTETSSLVAEEEKREEIVEKKEEIKENAKEDLQKTILKMVSEGKMKVEDANNILQELNRENPEAK